MRDLIGATLTAFVLATASWAQDAGPQIAVSGHGQVEVAPDLAVLDLGVQLRAETATEAMEQASETTQALLQALLGEGIAVEDVQTRRIGLRPVFDRSTDGASTPVPIGFEADSLLTVQIRDIAVLGDIYGAASEAGATRFDGLRFELSDPAAALAEARSAAVADARLRAESFAQAAGLSLGPVVTMAEPGSRVQPMAMRAVQADMMEAMPVAPGSLNVSAQIDIVYALTE